MSILRSWCVFHVLGTKSGTKFLHAEFLTKTIFPFRIQKKSLAAL